MGEELNNIGLIPYGDTYKIEIRFLGLFDTVISDIIVKEDIGHKVGTVLGPISPELGATAVVVQEALKDIKTDISKLGVGKVFHIRAEDEWRENFAYTPTEAGYTLGMLGAHSDIGGGYAELDRYTSILDFFDVNENNSREILQNKEKIRQFYINRQFCKEDEIWFEKMYDHTLTIPLEVSPIEYSTYEKKLSEHYVLKSARYISNKYSLVPMYIMLQKAIDYGVPFYKEATKNGIEVKYTFEHEIPNTPEYKVLREYFQLMLDISRRENGGVYSLPQEMYEHIRNRYVHLSAHYGGIHTLGHKAGDHHFTGDLLFINRPIAQTEDEQGNITYERGYYTP